MMEFYFKGNNPPKKIPKNYNNFQGYADEYIDSPRERRLLAKCERRFLFPDPFI